MRIDRLLAIVTYLLNRERATCARLAEEFEVSERTIQRDIDAINLAGIPILSERGARGGYRILDRFGFSKQTADEKDISHIRQALESLNTALGDKNISGTLEKIRSIHGNGPDNSVRVDFSIAKERKDQRDAVELLRKAITERRAVAFSYTGGTGRESVRTVEPIGLEFRWYAWYMAAFDRDSRDYRIFKLVRMEDIKPAKAFSGIEYGSPSGIFESMLAEDERTATRVDFTCTRSSAAAVREYLPVERLERIEGERFRGSAYVMEEERLWFAVILSLGDGIRIISPEHIRARIIGQAQKIIKSYE